MVLYSTDYKFYQRILKSSWIFIKKNRDIWNTKHFQNSIIYYLHFDFLLLLTYFFIFYLSIVVKKFLKFLSCFIVFMRDFIKQFCETMVFFKKIWDIWNPEFHQNSIVYYFFFLLAFLTSFFLFHLSKVVKKLWNFL